MINVKADIQRKANLIKEPVTFSLAHKWVKISFSGGKDSVASFLYARSYYPDHMIELIFTDTGDEAPETYDYCRWFHNNIFPITRLATMQVKTDKTRKTESLNWFTYLGMNPTMLFERNIFRYSMKLNTDTKETKNKGRRFHRFLQKEFDFVHVH